MCTTLSGRGCSTSGAAGGLAFSGRLPGIKSEALFYDISDAAEKRDLDQVGQIRRTVVARLRLDHAPDEPSPGKGGLDLAALASIVAEVKFDTGHELERKRDSRLRAARIRGLLGPVRSQHRRHSGGPRTARGDPSGRAHTAQLARDVRGSRASGIQWCRHLLEA